MVNFIRKKFFNISNEKSCPERKPDQKKNHIRNVKCISPEMWKDPPPPEKKKKKETKRSFTWRVERFNKTIKKTKSLLPERWKDLKNSKD